MQMFRTLRKPATFETYVVPIFVRKSMKPKVPETWCMTRWDSLLKMIRRACKYSAVWDEACEEINVGLKLSTREWEIVRSMYIPLDFAYACNNSL